MAISIHAFLSDLEHDRRPQLGESFKIVKPETLAADNRKTRRRQGKRIKTLEK
jgi:hypothetical protein